MPTARPFARQDQPRTVIGAPRPDGFHSLVTVYQTLEMHDVVTVTARGRRTTCACGSPRTTAACPPTAAIPPGRWFRWPWRQLGVTAEVEIHIDKRLPVQGGLGAGSANAVAALVGLETELETGTGIRDQGTCDSGIGTTGRCGCMAAQQLEIAAKVGSDVPLFLIGGTVLGRGSRAGGLSAARY